MQEGPITPETSPAFVEFHLVVFMLPCGIRAQTYDFKHGKASALPVELSPKTLDQLLSKCLCNLGIFIKIFIYLFWGVSVHMKERKEERKGERKRERVCVCFRYQTIIININAILRDLLFTETPLWLISYLGFIFKCYLGCFLYYDEYTHTHAFFCV